MANRCSFGFTITRSAFLSFSQAVEANGSRLLLVIFVCLCSPDCFKLGARPASLRLASSNPVAVWSQGGPAFPCWLCPEPSPGDRAKDSLNAAKSPPPAAEAAWHTPCREHPHSVPSLGAVKAAGYFHSTPLPCHPPSPAVPPKPPGPVPAYLCPPSSPAGHPPACPPRVCAPGGFPRASPCAPAPFGAPP